LPIQLVDRQSSSPIGSLKSLSETLFSFPDGREDGGWILDARSEVLNHEGLPFEEGPSLLRIGTFYPLSPAMIIRETRSGSVTFWSAAA
jgi:hypothetical protein